MSEDSKCSHVADTAVLHEIASTKSNNLKAFYIEQLQMGIIAVPSRVLKEFRELYEEEAAQLEPHIAKTVVLNPKYRAAAARIVDKNGSGFPRRPYDGDTDLYTAAIATVEGYTILTIKEHTTAYAGMDCEVVDLLSWLDSLGTPKRG